MSAERDYLSLPLRAFLTDAGSKSPTPGGVSVAAVVGALSACLARMAVAYSASKPQFAEHEGRLQALLDEFQQARDTFGQLMSDDMAAYEQLAAARARGDDERQQALLKAIAVPMEIIVQAVALAARLNEMKTFTNPHLMSDLQAAAVLASAAARAAATSLESNLAGLADRHEAERLGDQLDQLLARLDRHHNTVMNYLPE